MLETALNHVTVQRTGNDSGIRRDGRIGQRRQVGKGVRGRRVSAETAANHDEDQQRE